MALDTNVYLDARKRGGVARFINHSCQPNCVVERWKVRGILRAGVFAMRDLQAGEELCFDYQWERKRGRAPTKCHCLSPNCRGTLELARSLEEQELEQQLSGHWKKPLVKRAGREIVNRSIKIFYQQSQEYFPADVCKYDEESTKHLVIYRHDLEEVWEDLSQEDWMILDEEAEQHYIIAKKKNLHPATASSSSLVMSAEQSQLPSAQHLQQQHCMMNYLYIQTPIKELFWSKHLIERCERNCGVTIQPTQFARPPLPPDLNNPEEVEKYQALDQSLDGTVWKLTVVGADVVKALTILGKNVAYLEKKNTQQDATATSGTNRSAWGIVDEVIIPRCVVDLVKKRLAVIRDKCRSVNISFAPSDSKSKQFARLLLEGSLQSDVHNAKVQLWQHLVAACVEVNSPLANCGVPRDLGFLGGELTSEQFRHLFASEKERLNQDANEDMRRSAFFTSFESTQRCTVWVQSEGDKGRIDGMSNRVVNEALPNAPRKIFFGCDPKDIPRLWNLVETRAAEVSRGVKYLYLGADRMYQQHMMQRGGQFFDYVERVTGASVTVDPMTGDHLRLDGKGKSHKDDAEGVVQRSVAEIDRVALAEEVIRLQIELYRDHCIRDQNWVFGRDWTLISNFLSSTVTDAAATAVTPTPALARMASSSKSTLDEKAITTGCLDISDIASKLNLQGSVAAHAAVILYRFATLQGQNQDFAPQAKIREVAIASLFLANKAQKIIKWKRLATVLEAAYQTYYPGTQFDRNKEEVLVLEDRVIAAEYEILTVLNYDVFWRGVDWMLAAAIESGHVAEPLARNAFEFAVSGPVLAAGPTLWLKYGPEYVFAAVAGFLSIDIEHLFTALNLIPLKVSQAAELIAHSIKFGNSSRKAAFHEVLNGGKQSLLNHLPHIKDTCIKSMSKGLVVGVGNRITATSESQQRFQIIGSQLRQRRAYVGVEPAIVRDSVMPILDGISAESTCRIFVDKSSLEAGEDLILEGSWRAIAIAEHLLEAAMGNDGSFMAVDLPVEQISQGKLQAKCQPGLLQMGDVHTCDGWSGTIQASLTNNFTWGRKTGGKCCVAAKLQESTLREAGLRWWIPPRYGPSTSGSICEMFSLRSCETNLLTALKNLTKAFVGQAGQFPMLSEETSCEVSHDRNVAVSIQRWPSEKVAAREQERTSASKESGLQMGFSAAALQELQLLTELHGLIPSPLGHPNFMLPFGIAIPSPSPEIEPQQPDNDTEEDIFSLFRTSEENEKAARKQQKHKDLTTGPHLIFQPTPFVLQRFMSKKKIRDTSNGESSTLSQTLISSWFHDLLSGLVHCHANNVILRSLQSDQVVVDHAGVAKLGGFYRATVFAPEDLEKAENHLKSARAGSRKEKSDEEDYPNTGFVAPENLLGSMKHNKQTDIWAMGCLLANLLLGKPLFVGKDRESLLLSVYKVVGTPSKENYSEATKFSLYRKPTKKYKRGVEKAIRHMLTESGGRECEGAIDLLAQMLHLDPKKRITAVDTLKHHYMLDYLENCNSKSFQRDYVKGWLALKEKLLKQTKMEEDEAQTRARSLKRKANLIAASQAMDQEDDLYDMDELVLGSLSHKAA
jgi:serine/threonine protein kinase